MNRDPRIGMFYRATEMTAPVYQASGAISAMATADAVPASRGRLLHKLLAIFLALSILPLLLAGYQLIAVGEHYIQNQVIQVKKAIAQKVASNVISYLDDKVNVLRIVQQSKDFLTMEPSHQKFILSNVMQSYPIFMRMKVVDLSGNEITTVNLLDQTERPTSDTEVSENVEALRVIRLGKTYSGPLSRSVEGYPRMTLGVPIIAAGHTLGVLLGSVNLTELSSLVRGIAIDEKGYVYIVDLTTKRLVAHPDVLGTLLSKESPVEVQAATLAPEDKRAGALEFSDQASHRFLATYSTTDSPSWPELHWRVIVQQPIEEAYQASRQMRHEIVKVLLIVTLLTIVLGYWISNKLVQRVQTLQLAMESVGEGNFDVPDVPSSNDEFGSLTERFVSMAASLKEKTQSLLGAQHELQRWNTELEARVQTRTRDLKAAQEQVIASEKLAVLGQMASVVGHELRNPLAVMNNSVYFLKTKLSAAAGEAGLDPKIDKYLKMIESEIGKSNMIIRDVLDFSRNRALHAKPIGLDDLVLHSIERINLPAGVEVKKDLHLGVMEVPLDEDEIRQVLVNLMENACQAMISGGMLLVGTKTQGESVEVVIGDTGCGISVENVAKIFAPFFTTKSRGTGLGLAVVKKIIDRHQGTIKVDSKVGEGTRFTIRLPLVRKGEKNNVLGDADARIG
jgi:signal transduction histidine kinase